MEYQKLSDLIHSIQSYVAATPGAVIQTDCVPEKKLLGFSSGPRVWRIHLDHLKTWLWVDSKYLNLAPENLDLFTSESGRQELARRLTAGEQPFTKMP